MKGVRTDIRICRPKRLGFMGRFGGLKTLCPFWFGIGYGFRGNYGSVHVRMYLSFSILDE